MRLATGLASVVAALALLRWAGDVRAHPALAAAAFALAIVGAVLLVRAARAAVPRVLLLALLGLRAAALLAGLGPSLGLSDDQFRYVHEGRAQRAGPSLSALAVPYETPPAALVPPPAPDDGTSARVNHPDVPAAYPPGSELVLLATVAIGDAIGRPMAPLRAALIACDLFVLVALYRRRRALAHSRTGADAFVYYGAHPLPLLEIVIGAHLDGLGIAALLAGVLASQPALRGALIGLAAHAKPVAALGLVAIPRRALLAALLGFSVAVFIPTIPYLLAGAPLTRGFVEYATRWRAAPFVYAALEAPLRPVFERRAAAGTYAHLHVTSHGVVLEEAGVPLVTIGDREAQGRAVRPLLLDAGFFARLLAGALLASILVVIARFGRARREAKVGWALAAFWLLAPTVHPWYLTWLVPFAALSSSRALLFFAGAAPLLYQPVFHATMAGTPGAPGAPGTPWSESAWPRVVVIAALLAGAWLDWRDARQTGRPPPS